MKRSLVAGLLVAGLLLGATAPALLAQNGPGPGSRGCGYGGPPKSDEERAARQAACQAAGQQCTGPCVTGEPRDPRCGFGPGAGNGNRRGLRDGTGPRNVNGTCPIAKPAAGK